MYEIGARCFHSRDSNRFQALDVRAIVRWIPAGGGEICLKFVERRISLLGVETIFNTLFSHSFGILDFQHILSHSFAHYVAHYFSILYLLSLKSTRMI